MPAPGRGLGAGAVAIALAALLAGCAAPDDDEGGLGVPTADLLDLPPAAEHITGTIELANNGCFHLRTQDGRHFLVWPPGVEQDGAVVRGTDARSWADGDLIAGRGWTISVDDAVRAADGPDGYLDSVTGFCATEDEAVAVIVELAAAPR